MTKSWRQIADEHVANGYREVIQREGMTPAKAIQIVSKEYYPFGQRAHFPYKAWRASIKSKKIVLGLIAPPGYKDSPKFKGSLFDQEKD